MNSKTDNSQKVEFNFIEKIVCEKSHDSSIASDSFMNIIKNSTFVQQPIVYQEITVKQFF